MRDNLDHLRWVSLGEETESTSYEETDRNRYIIPQVDGTMDSRDSLNQTTDSIDLTESPVKHTKVYSIHSKVHKEIWKRVMKIQVIMI